MLLACQRLCVAFAFLGRLGRWLQRPLHVPEGAPGPYFLGVGPMLLALQDDLSSFVIKRHHLQVREVAAEAIARARRGDGPTLIEAETYRFRGHSLADPDELRQKEEKDHYAVSYAPCHASCEPLGGDAWPQHHTRRLDEFPVRLLGVMLSSVGSAAHGTDSMSSCKQEQ